MNVNVTCTVLEPAVDMDSRIFWTFSGSFICTEGLDSSGILTLDKRRYVVNVIDMQIQRRERQVNVIRYNTLHFTIRTVNVANYNLITHTRTVYGT